MNMAKLNYGTIMENRKPLPSVKDEITNINAIDEGTIMKIVPLEQIKPSNLNSFEVTREDIDSLKESIRRNEIIIHSFLLMPIDDEGDGCLYKTLSGESRYYAIKELIEEGFEKYRLGVPAILTKKNLSETQQQILIREANIKQRKYSPKKVSETIQELVVLYKQLNEENKTNESPIKKVADYLHVSERTIQRHNALGSLIPELKELFDKSKIDLKRAAQFSNMDEQSQQMVVDLLKENSSITKQEAEEAISLQKEKELKQEEEIQKLNKLLTDSESEKLNIQVNLKKKEEEINNLIKDKNSEIEDIKNQEQEKRLQLESELEKSNPNNEEVEKLKKELELLTESKKDSINKLEQNLKEIQLAKEKELDIKNKEIEKIKIQLEEIQKKPKIEISEQEQERIKTEIEIKNLTEVSIKNIKTLQQKIIDADKKGLKLKFDSEIAEIHNMIINNLNLNKY